MANKKISLIITLILLLTLSPMIFAQGGRVDEIQSVLSRFKQYRFGAVNVYEITSAQEIKEIMDAKKSAAEGGGDMKEAEEILNSIKPEVQGLIKQGVIDGKTNSGIQQDIIMQGFDLPDPDTFKKVYDYFDSALTYLQRYKTPEFAVLFIRMVTTKRNELRETKTFTEFSVKHSDITIL